MSTIDVNSLITLPITAPLYNTDGGCNIDVLYGPWPSDVDLTDMTWMTSNFDPNNWDKFIGLTIGVKSSDGKKVEEYQLEKQGDNDFVFVKKGFSLDVDTDFDQADVPVHLKYNDNKLYLRLNTPLYANTTHDCLDLKCDTTL